MPLASLDPPSQCCPGLLRVPWDPPLACPHVPPPCVPSLTVCPPPEAVVSSGRVEKSPHEQEIKFFAKVRGTPKCVGEEPKMGGGARVWGIGWLWHRNPISPPTPGRWAMGCLGSPIGYLGSPWAVWGPLLHVWGLCGVHMVCGCLGSPFRGPHRLFGVSMGCFMSLWGAYGVGVLGVPLKDPWGPHRVLSCSLEVPMGYLGVCIGVPYGVLGGCIP